MTDTESVMFVRLLVGLYSAQASKLTERALDDMPIGYQLGLADVDAATATAALQRIARSSRFMPTVAEIREEILSGGTGGRGPRRIGSDAWGDVVIARRLYGRQDSRGAITSAPVETFSKRDDITEFQFVDPIVHEAVMRLGWRTIVLAESEASERARFAEIYDAIAIEVRKRATIATIPAPDRTLPAAPPAHALTPGKPGKKGSR